MQKIGESWQLRAEKYVEASKYSSNQGKKEGQESEFEHGLIWATNIELEPSYHALGSWQGQEFQLPQATQDPGTTWDACCTEKPWHVDSRVWIGQQEK